MEEIREEIKKLLEYNKNENSTYQDLKDTAKAVVREKFIAMNSYIKKKGKSKRNNLCCISNS
jgi:predicted transcriptional regulator